MHNSVHSSVLECFVSFILSRAVIYRVKRHVWKLVFRSRTELRQMNANVFINRRKMTTMTTQLIWINYIGLCVGSRARLHANASANLIYWKAIILINSKIYGKWIEDDTMMIHKSWRTHIHFAYIRFNRTNAKNSRILCAVFALFIFYCRRFARVAVVVIVHTWNIRAVIE